MAKKISRWVLSQSANLIASSLNHQFFLPQPLWLSRPERLVDPGTQIKKLISSGKPFLVSRFGNTELEVLLGMRRRELFSNVPNFLLAASTGDPNFVYRTSPRRIQSLGLTPLTGEVRSRFISEYLESMVEIDLLGSWVEGENYFDSELHSAKVARLGQIEPYRNANPWSASLEGLKVLVVHPFTESIKFQYAHRRMSIFQDPNVLPVFDLKLLMPPRAHFGEVPSAEEWFRKLGQLKDDALSIDFELAIIGAGPFGLPLGASLKRAGKQVVHLGGATQLLFGIWGRRWDRDAQMAAMRNANWKTPYPDETPSRAGVELSAGSYWG